MSCRISLGNFNFVIQLYNKQLYEELRLQLVLDYLMLSRKCCCGDRKKRRRKIDKNFFPLDRVEIIFQRL